MAAPTVTQRAASRTGEFPPTSKRKIINADFVADGTVGALPNDILASLFGLTFIETCGPALKNDNTLIVVCAPSADGLSLLGKAAASAAPANIPAGTYNIVIEGY